MLVWDLFTLKCILLQFVELNQKFTKKFISFSLSLSLSACLSLAVQNIVVLFSFVNVYSVHCPFSNAEKTMYAHFIKYYWNAFGCESGGFAEKKKQTKPFVNGSLSLLCRSMFLDLIWCVLSLFCHVQYDYTWLGELIGMESTFGLYFGLDNSTDALSLNANAQCQFFCVNVISFI